MWRVGLAVEMWHVGLDLWTAPVEPRKPRELDYRLFVCTCLSVSWGGCRGGLGLASRTNARDRGADALLKDVGRPRWGRPRPGEFRVVVAPPLCS
jgi:hypothetical protein